MKSDFHDRYSLKTADSCSGIFEFIIIVKNSEGKTKIGKSAVVEGISILYSSKRVKIVKNWYVWINFFYVS